MTAVGRRPTLYELLEALHAIEKVEADIDALDHEAKTFRVVLTFQRAQCPQDWHDGAPKPTWLFEQIMEELSAWLLQRNKEEQWVSKEEQFGASIDTLMAYWTEELKKNATIKPENMLTRALKQVLSNTIMRLLELKERRAAGGVYSRAESGKEKARKAWMEDEYEAPKREEEQRRQQEKRDWAEGPAWFGADYASEKARTAWDDIFAGTFTGFTGQKQQDPQKPQSNNKQRWYEILGVPVTANTRDIQKAYRRLAARYHPDRYKEADGHAKMAEINTARDEGIGGML